MKSATKRVGLALTVLCLFTVASRQTKAGLVLHSVDAKQLYGTRDTVLTDLGTTLVDPVATFHDVQGHLTLEVRNSTISVTSNLSGLLLFNQADFNGFSFTDTTGTANIVGVSLDPTSSFYNVVPTSFTANSVFLNFENLGFNFAGQSLVLDLQFAPAATSAPEPSTLVSASIAGLMGLGYAQWRRRGAA